MTSEAIQRFTAPVARALAARIPEDTPLKPVVVEAPAAPAEISEGAKRVQKIIEAMDLRRQERARQIGLFNSRQVEVDRENREAKKRADDAVIALNEEWARRISTVKADFDNGVQARLADLRARESQIAHIDQALANFRTQLNAELGKLDPEAKGGA